ncbi:MAG: ATP synthase subunit I [Solimonas sp.]
MSGPAPARAVCLAQLVIAMLTAAACGGYYGMSGAIAALWGGLTAVVPTVYFAWRALARRAQETPADVVGAMFRGEIGRVALTAVLFWFGVMLFAGRFLALLVTFAACQLAWWLVLARVGFDKRNDGN